MITGEEGAVALASEAMKEAGARRIVSLNVSGPFHSQMLQGAGEELAKVLADIPVQEIQTPYITNVTADYVKDKKRGKRAFGKTGQLFRKMAAERGAHAGGWGGYLCGNRAWENVEWIFKKNRPERRGCSNREICRLG